MLSCGLVGIRGSGKSTLFRALSGLKVESRGEAGRAVLAVPDERVDALASLFGSARKVYPQVEVVDVRGFSPDDPKEAASFLQEARECDCLVEVLRGFELPGLKVDLWGELQALELEMAFADAAQLERRLSKIREGKRKEEEKREEALLLRLLQAIERGEDLRGLSLSEEEKKKVLGFNLLSLKPRVRVVNCDLEGLKDPLSIPGYGKLKEMGIYPLLLCAKLEAEIGELSPEEASEFVRELGLPESRPLKALVLEAYRALDLISFLTAGPKEARAWTIRRGTRAQSAAGAIHSDMERGFIRAQVVRFEDLVKEGSLASCREKGLLRLEGRDYLVQDGDVIEFRFHV